jgi:hypothetical protein
MKKTTKKIYKKNKKFKVNIINFEDPEVIKKIEEINKKQQECLDRKKVDLEKLNNTYIDI